MAFIPALNGRLNIQMTSFLASHRPLATTRRKHLSPVLSPCRLPASSSLDSDQSRIESNKAPSKTTDREARVQLWREVEALKKSLRIAVNAERFSDAARLRDEINSLSLADDYFRTEMELKKAVKEQRFAEAARLRDALTALEPPPGLSTLRGDRDSSGGVPDSRPLAEMDSQEVENWSKTLTNGILVHVESHYLPEQSVPEHHKFMFAYKVTITNEGNETCQLVSRHWIIEGAGSPKSEVKGSGVVGRQPVLAPGKRFEYTSACPLTVELKDGQSVVGSMRGYFHFCKGDTGAVRFSVNIDPFFMKLPFRNYRPSG
eukprot:GFKZ01009770.1.p1 GENE.GFKZ01009770.1~~GFKZ01009770.1.p1  ORF type:complete len:317 (+),score=35.67 GFKZ01009770.1:438-1388(+)